MTEDVENIYPDGDKSGHTDDENCPCKPEVYDYMGTRTITHYALNHKREKELETIRQDAFDLFHEIAIESDDRRVIEMAKDGMKRCKDNDMMEFL